MFKCHLVCRSSSEYLTQLFAGFGNLHAKNIIHLSYEKAENYVPGVNKHPRLRMILNNSIKVFYDMRDINEWYEEDLEWCDFYFKRSYDAELVARYGYVDKIFPYGFNYPVYSSYDSAYRRILYSISSLPSYHSKADIRQITEQIVRANKLLSKITGRENGRENCAVENYEDIPHFEKQPIINFFTRLWDPSETPDQYKGDAGEVNQMRVECVKKLRQEFGDLFMGGIVATPYALNHFREYVVDKELTIKKNYLKLLKEATICVTTLGVVGSNGWKMGELIAASKAIVCEKRRYQVPGNFANNRNYLEFSTADECVEQVHFLMDNPEKNYEMMVNNLQYYHLYLKPDMLIWNTLKVIFDRLNIKYE